jgi:tetratricopeptide (TPR) repeat protein
MGNVRIAAGLVCQGAEEPRHIIELMERDGMDWESISQFMFRVASECINLRYYDAAEMVLNTVLDLSKKKGDRKTESNCLMEIGRLMRIRSREADAVRYYSEAAEISMELGDAISLGVAHSHISEILWLMGDMEQAVKHSRKAYETIQIVEEDAGVDIVKRTGDILLDMQRYEEAYKEYWEAIRIAEKLGDTRIKSSCLSGAGIALKGMGRLEEALESYLEAIRIDRDIGDTLGEQVCLIAAGVILLRLGRVEEALEQFNTALQISEECNDAIGEANALFHIGFSNIFLKNDKRVNETFEEAIQTFEKWSVSVSLLVALNIYLDYLLSRGESEKAEMISRKISQYKIEDPYEDPLVRKRMIKEKIEEMREILKLTNDRGKVK